MQENLKRDGRIPKSASADVKNGKLRVFLNAVKKKMLFPFRHDLFYFLLLWIVFSFPDCYMQLRNVIYVGYLAMMYYIIAYVVDVILNLHQGIAKLLKPVVLVLALFTALLNLYCYRLFNCLISNDFIQIMAGTNLDEAKEFLDTYISWIDIFLFIFVIVSGIVVAVVLPKRVELKKAWILPAVILFISIGAIWHNSGIIETELFNKTRWSFSFDEVVDLRNHPTHPEIEERDSIHPEHIVIVLGESFSRNHSSLYGYEKETNPFLKQLVKDGDLFVFNHVKSPCTFTTATFKYILNTFQIEEKTEKPWYEHTNIIEVMNIAGYHTVWISNQAEKGMYDNLPSGHAKLCDEKYFLGNEKNTDRYDGELVGKFSNDSQAKCVIFYHLMGQHEKFRERYPEEFEIFKKDDYEAYPEHQRDVLASYDNATLYNDYVVNSIMDLYKDKDAVVFYFSDHALDVFDTESDFFGHAKKTEASQAQGKKIPFMIYVSSVFQERHGEKVELIKNKVDESFCTDRFIYIVMDIAGFQFADK